MSRKRLFQLQAGVYQNKVKLSFYKKTPSSQSKDDKQSEDVVSVYRKSEPGFIFGQDYDEYFDGLDWREAELIFKGALPAINKRKFEYIDDRVEVGKTYVYWVTMDGEELPVGPAPVRVRDNHVWWPQAETERRMAALADTYPGRVTLKTFGSTVKGRPLNGMIAGNPARVVALVGTVHAGESGPELIVPAFERLIRENEALLEKAGAAVMPSVNIDERERLVNGYPPYLRVNANGVDINRNFDANWEEVGYGYGLVTSDPDSMTYRGEHPASESETKAIIKFVDEIKPTIVLSFHALASICGARFLFPAAAEADKQFVEKCRQLADIYGKAMYPDQKVEVKVSPGCTVGSLAAWLYRQHRIIGFDLEYDGVEHARPALTDLTTRDLVKEYQERHYQGMVALMNALA